MNVLLVEDDPGIGRIVMRGLTAEGYRVEWQRAGRRVAASLATNAFSAAVLDLGLPDIDGLDLCRDLRARGIDTPVLMLTARAALEDRLDGFQSGADDYLAKPFSFAELVARLKALVQRGTARRGATITLGALSIDTGLRVATIGTAALTLSSREFDLLRHLAARSEAVVPRAELLDGVWGAEADVAENSLDVYIGYVRRRLAAHRGAPVIETVRGAGYRLVRPKHEPV